MAETPPSRRSNLNTFILVLILAMLVGMAYFIVVTIRAAVQTATAPFQGVQHANEALQTQVSQLMHPTPTIIPDPVTYINEVRALARLETIQYSVEKVIKGEENQGFLAFISGDKILFVGHGVVSAGIDMEKMQPQDMRLEGGVLYVKLPAAEIFVATLDNDKSYVYDRQTGLIRKADPNLETQVRQTAEDEIRKAALDDGILAQAQTNAEAYLLKFFNALGYKSVIFEEAGK
jgi:hypothetical protein